MANRKKSMMQPAGVFRSPTNDVQDNGVAINPPLYPQFGGAKTVSRMVKKNRLTISHTRGK